MKLELEKILIALALKSERTSAYLCETGRKEDTLVQFAHLLQKLIDVGPLEDVNLVRRAVNLHRDDEVGVVDGLQKRS